MTGRIRADRFRPGDTWASPSGKHWYVQRVDQRGRAVLRNTENLNSRQYRGTLATGNDMSDAWIRIDPPDPEL